MQRILIIGGGFAGTWSAAAAQLAIRRFGLNAEVCLISRDGYLTNRPRLYEPPAASLRVPLEEILGPIGVTCLQAEVTALDPREGAVSAGDRRYRYDRLVLAAGSGLHRPALPGLAAHAFSIDTFADAQALAAHLERLPALPHAARWTAVVVGGGSTGIELAANLGARLRSQTTDPVRVVLVDRQPRLLPFLHGQPATVVADALAAAGVEVRCDTGVAALSAAGVTLSTGEEIPAATVVWTGGLRASALTAQLGVACDDLGRLPVSETMQVLGVEGVYAGGDVARAVTDGRHLALMTCQHAGPQGRFAGYNAVCDLAGQPPVPYAQQQYQFCIDLGPAAGLVTRGWERELLHTGPAGKAVKQIITQHLIIPPAGQPVRLLAAADPHTFRKQDLASQKGVMKWATAKIPPGIGLFFLRWRTAWSGASRTPRT